MKTIKLVEGEKRIGDYKISTNLLCDVIGLGVCGLLISYFFIMRYFNLHEVFVLRYLNAFILFPGILFAFRAITKRTGEKIEYFDGLKYGIKVTVAAAIPFAIFMGIYLSNDSGFMELIKQSFPGGKFLNPVSAGAVTALEGVVSGIIMTYVILPYFKKA